MKKRYATPAFAPVTWLEDAKRSAAFYRKTLEQIASGRRRTLERRLAESALTFWDALKAEAASYEADRGAPHAKSVEGA